MEKPQLPSIKFVLGDISMPAYFHPSFIAPRDRHFTHIHHKHHVRSISQPYLPPLLHRSVAVASQRRRSVSTPIITTTRPPAAAAAAASSASSQTDDIPRTSTAKKDDAAVDRYRCPHCQKGFSRPSSLRIHIYSHTGEKPFDCPEPGCGRKFSVQSNMRRHLRVHQHFATATPVKKQTVVLVPVIAPSTV